MEVETVATVSLISYKRLKQVLLRMKVEKTIYSGSEDRDHPSKGRSAGVCYHGEQKKKLTSQKRRVHV